MNDSKVAKDDFHIDLDSGRFFRVWFDYRTLRRAVVSAIGVFDGQSTARTIENEWEDFIRTGEKVIWKRDSTTKEWAPIKVQRTKFPDILRHQIPFGVVIPLSNTFADNRKRCLFLEFTNNNFRDEWLYHCSFSACDESARLIEPSIEQLVANAIDGASFKNGLKLMNDNPGIVWRALKEIAHNKKNVESIKLIVGKIAEEANRSDMSFTIDTGFALKDGLDIFDAKPRSRIFLSFSVNCEPWFSFGDNHDDPTPCSECIPALERFAYIPMALIRKLAETADEEDWTFLKENGDPVYFGGLRYYLNATFEKIRLDHEQGWDRDFPEIVEDDERQTVVFCTGLLHREFGTYIYAHCSEQDDFGVFQKVEWAFQSRDNHGKYIPHPLLKDLPNGPIGKKHHGLPYPANWTQNPNELIIPYRRFHKENVRFEFRHIFGDNAKRIKLPSGSTYLANKQALAHFYRIILPRTRKQLARNYKVAIPTWYNHSINFLLPLFLDDSHPNEPSAALVVVKNRHRKNEHDPEYIAVTCLSLEMVRRNARVIAPIEDTWLAKYALPHHVSDKQTATGDSGSVLGFCGTTKDNSPDTMHNTFDGCNLGSLAQVFQKLENPQ